MQCVIFLLSMIGVLAIGAILSYLRIKIIAMRRSGEGFEEFCETFKESGIPIEILKNVYEEFGSWCHLAHPFPVRADDGIHEIYGIDDDGDDFIDVINNVLLKCGCSMPSGQQYSIVTVRDFTNFVWSIVSKGKADHYAPGDQSLRDPQISIQSKNST